VADFIGDPFLMFKQKLKRVKVALSQWSKLIYGDIFKKLAIMEDIVRVKEILFEDEPTIENRIVLQKAQAELKKYLSIEEQYWKQKAGMNWFAEGYRNTRFFHNHGNGKRQKLQLKRIQNSDGDWIETQEHMTKVAVDFFQKQFTKEADPTSFELLNNHVNGKRQKLQPKRIQNSDSDCIETQEHMAEATVDFFQKQFTKEVDPTSFELLNNVPTMMSNEKNAELYRIPSRDEVKGAVYALSGESASGPDGFTGIFF